MLSVWRPVWLSSYGALIFQCSSFAAMYCAVVTHNTTVAASMQPVLPNIAIINNTPIYSSLLQHKHASYSEHYSPEPLLHHSLELQEYCLLLCRTLPLILLDHPPLLRSSVVTPAANVAGHPAHVHKRANVLTSVTMVGATASF